MKITISWLPPGVAPTTPPNTLVLADSPANVPITDFSKSVTRSTQVDRPVRSLSVLLNDRRNKQCEWSFTVTRQFASQYLAEDFAELFDETFPGIFSMTIVSGPGTVPNTVRVFPVAVAATVSSKAMGCTVYTTHKITSAASSKAQY